MVKETPQINQLPDSKLAQVIINEDEMSNQSIFKRFLPSKKVQLPEVIKLDKFGNFKMYEQFFDLQVGDIREIPNLNTLHVMFREYLETWSLVFDPKKEANELEDKQYIYDFRNSIQNSGYALNNNQRIEEMLSDLKSEKNHFLIFPHLASIPLNEEEKSLATNTVEGLLGKKLAFANLLGSYIEKQKDQYVVKLMNIENGSLQEFLIDETRKKELAAILGSLIHFDLAHETSLDEKLGVISRAQTPKQKIQDDGIHLKQHQFLIPQFSPMILFACRQNTQEQHQFLGIHLGDEKKWMNEFHEAAVYRIRTLQYPETIIDSMNRVHSKANQEDLLLKKWQKNLNELEKELETAPEHAQPIKKEEERVGQGMTLDSNEKKEVELLEDAVKHLSLSNGLVLPKEIKPIIQSLENSKKIFQGEASVAKQLDLLVPGSKTSFLVTSHLIGIHQKEGNDLEKQEIGCVIRKKESGDFLISFVDPTGYYQKLTQVNGKIPYVHEFEVSILNRGKLANILKVKDYLKTQGSFGLQRLLSMITRDSGKVTEYAIEQRKVESVGKDLHHFPEAIKFAIFTSTHQLGHYVYLGDCESLKKAGQPNIAGHIKNERTLRNNYPDSFEKRDHPRYKPLERSQQRKMYDQERY
ncbi:hypothetical protein [Enterococcus villorum]|uniref:Uncharacterized protein n=3 Tax=Enterococcus villorum TaxID=112904 RepID=A0A511IYI4_9ENTE|nr:hypothetical protein [Enterococcus villorum]EOH89884.1 hypothetical protein UAO_01128 [Enterococcus villorum ATCC 700913]EOW78116.1 hypothetical protein I591_00971 [Enterococcus villorum ATCC 700913]GEL90830.1 hypothetical protein EVI01_01670 [Enterococcus villorum]